MKISYWYICSLLLFVSSVSIDAGTNNSMTKEQSRNKINNVRTYGAKGDGISDDTVAIQSALNARGNVLIPEGVYIVKDLVLYDNTKLYGVFGKSKLKMKFGSTYIISVNPGASGTSNPENNSKNIIIRNIIFEGRSVEDGFKEHSHNINLNAVSDVKIENCNINAFRGDGIYLGSGNVGNIERHNKRVIISECRFNGTNKKNRNAISIIDGEDITIRNSYFTMVSSPNMPGAVDIEPDNTYNVVNNINISNNIFRDIGGNVGAIALVLNMTRSKSKNLHNFSILNNEMDNVKNGITVLQRSLEKLYLDDIRIESNRIVNSERPINIQSANTLVIRNNIFDKSKMSSLLGYTVASSNVSNVSFESNVWKEGGQTSGSCLDIFYAENISFKGDKFIDCGNYKLSIGASVNFKNGSSKNIKFINTEFADSNGTTKVAIQKEVGHNFSPSTNIFKDCIIKPSLKNKFEYLQ